MFFLSLIELTLRLPSHLLDLSLNETIKGELESQFLDKVWRLSIVFAFAFCYCDSKAFKGLRRMCCDEGYCEFGAVCLCLWYQIYWWWLCLSCGWCFNLYGMRNLNFCFYNLSIWDCGIACIFLRFQIELKKAMGWINFYGVSNSSKDFAQSWLLGRWNSDWLCFVHLLFHFLTLKIINAELKESATMAYNACLKASYSFDYKLIKIFLHLLLHFSSVNLGISVTILITHTCNVCIYAHHLTCWVLPIFVSSLVGLKLNTTSWLLYGMITC